MKLLTASLILVTVMLNPLLSAADLKLQKTCGEIECSMYYYCDPAQLLCRNCEPICNDTSVRYHPETCEVYCQDYIHDSVRGYSRSSADIQLAIINSIYWQQTIMLVMLVVLVLLVGSIVTRSWFKYFKTRRQRRIDDKRFKEKLASVQYTISMNSPSSDGNVKCITQPTAIRSSLPSASTLNAQTETPSSTNQLQSPSQTLPISNEEPSEDATLDYAAYVNQCLTRSPSIEANLATSRRY